MLRGLYVVSVIAAIVLFVMKLAPYGLFTPEQLALMLVILVALLAITGPTNFLRKAQKVLLTVAGFAFFIIWHTDGNPAAMTALLSAIGTLIIALCGIYIMVRGVFAKKRR